MLICNHAVFEAWQPDLSDPGKMPATWTRVLCGGVELCNSLEVTVWRKDPVQVQICECCGSAQQHGSGRYVHISTLPGFVLWTPSASPYGNALSDLFAERFGAVMFPEHVWRAIESRIPVEARQTHLIPAHGRALVDAWATGQQRPQSCLLIEWMRRKLLAADTLDLPDAMSAVQSWMRWFEQEVVRRYRGAFARYRNATRRSNTCTSTARLVSTGQLLHGTKATWCLR